MLDLIASGYVSLDSIIKVDSPLRTGKTSLIESQNINQRYIGGCNVNVCVLLGNLGHRVAPIFRAGIDYVKSGLKDYLVEHNVNLDGITKIDSEFTSYSYLIETPKKEHVTLFYPGAMSPRYHQPIKNSLLKNVNYALMTVAPEKDNVAFLNQCKDKDIPIIFGMKRDEAAFPKDFLYEVLTTAKLIFMNEKEMTNIVTLYNFETIENLFSYGACDTVVITKGKQGSRIINKNNHQIARIDIPPIVPECVVDTSGSGDAYIAGFLHGYFKHLPLKKCGLYGAALASFVIEAVGCTSNAPTKEQLQIRMQQSQEVKT